MILNNLAVLQVILPLMAAPICIIFKNAKVAWYLAAIISVLCFAVSLALLQINLTEGKILYNHGGWSAPVGIEYNIDIISAFMLGLVNFIAVTTIFFAKKSVASEVDKHQRAKFYCLYLLCLGGLNGILSTNDVFNIYVFFEISSLAIYALISIGKDRRALLASFEYLILGSIGATFILIAIGLLYMLTGTLNINDIAANIPAKDNIVLLTSLGFLIIGLLLKIALFPLHIWLVNSYVNAPSFISSFLSATATKVSIYVLVRFLYFVYELQLDFTELHLDKIFMILAVAAILAGAVKALFQQNLKRILAYSSVSQIGYIILAISLNSHFGIISSFTHIVAHSISKALLFISAGIIYYKFGNIRLSHLRGIAEKSPLAVICFAIGGASLVGIPGTVGFISKWYLLQALLESQNYILLGVILISSLIAAIYVMRVVEIMFFKSDDNINIKIRKVPFSMNATMIFLALITIIAGIYSVPLVNLAAGIAEYIFQGNSL